MLDDRIKLERPDRDRINVNDNQELNHWVDKFGVTNVKLKAAINAAGNSIKDVEGYLKKSKPS